MSDLLRCKLFPIGNIQLSQSIADEVRQGELALFNFAMLSVLQHKDGNWGNISPETRLANNQAIHTSRPIVSAYSRDDIHILVITTADRSLTMILKPEELDLGVVVSPH